MARQTLRIVLENVDFRLPTQVTDDNSVVALKSLVFEPLLRWQPQGAVKPALFDHWTQSEEGRTWHFHIRDNAIFHDGKPCTASEVVTYINGFLDSRDYFGMRWSYARYFKHTTFTAVNDQTVRVENPDPIADILDIFCEFWPSRIDTAGKPVLGTGPYRVTEFERVDDIGHAILELVDKASSTPQQIIATHEPNGEKRLHLLQTGQVDVALNLERADNLDVLDFSPNLRWGRITSTLSAMFYLNCTARIFESPDARLAANLAVDRVALVKEVYQGFAIPAATIVSPFHLGFQEANLQPIPYDPKRARSLLKNLGTGTPIIFRTPEWMPEHAVKISRFVAASLEAVGFTVSIEIETNRPEYARSIGLRKQIGDLALFDSTPNSTFRVLDDKVSSEARNTWWLGYHDEEVQRLFGDAKRKIHYEERARAYAKCLRRVQEDPPWLFVAHPDVVWASALDVAVDIGPSGILSLAKDRSE
ncbi:uncharacterized protein APUU_10325S [Aspergillus puulaauensis]|uniref:Solute-binding protein family 5 domain-containing protein n=1 Tax=Aspergillus puulaauensis TaxID=1220207 RepID=A0A7R7X9U0_9EURO|nr:uncharacterized protein APUU_10325S [Aspergillus puulaauensis]BCS17497.1 hypothetical protein APUU_10325S [Aspergillus puulaauensis]